MNISLPVYAQCLLVTVLYCVIALPFVVLFLLLNCYSPARMQGVIRFFILWYGKTIIRIGCFPYLRIRFRDLSGFRLYAVDFDGNRIAEIPMCHSAGKTSFTLKTDCGGRGVIAYELTGNDGKK